MKKFMIIAASAGMLLVGCAKNETSFTSKGEKSAAKITFSVPVTAVSTKGSGYFGPIDGVYPEAENFEVYGLFSPDKLVDGIVGDKYMEKVKCEKKTANGWEPSESDYYWPKNGCLHFHAISPDGVAHTHDWEEGGFSLTGYIATDNIGAQRDLLISDISFHNTAAMFKDGDNEGEDAAFGAYAGVDIYFRHALSAVKCSFRTADDYSGSTTITVKSVKFVNVFRKGNFNEGRFNNCSNYYGFTWDAHSEPVEYIAQDTDVILNTTAQVGENVNIVLPQLLYDEVKLVVEYTMQTNGGEAITQIAETRINALTAGSEVLSKWEPGKRYTYNVIIGLNKIYFDPAVEPWDDITVDKIEY